MVFNPNRLRLAQCQRFVKFFSQEVSDSSQFNSNTSAPVPPVRETDSIKAWRINAYGKSNNLKLDEIKAPIIQKPNQVLVQVKSTSVNPIDVAMLGGYGNVILDILRKVDPHNEAPGLPLTPGRDFTGVVLAKGSKVRADLLVGDTVYGVIPPHKQGCHAQTALVDDFLVLRKPESISNEEASGILYAGLTACSALKVTGDMALLGPKINKVLVIGAAGGVGHLAVQMLKAWNVEVAATCKPDAIPILESYNVDHIVDYTGRDHMSYLSQIGKFDIILDASGNVEPSTYVPLLKDWANAKFISLRSPMLQNTDSLGLFAGMAKNATDFVKSNLESGAPKKGSTIRWGFFLPIPQGVNAIGNLVAEGKLKPIVEKVFKFSEVPAAYDLMAAGSRRGKVVINVSK